MGGDYYGGRDVISDNTTSTSSGGQSSAPQQVGASNYHPSLDPKKWKDENLQTEALHPIIFALDITGSMGDWVQIVYNKMPMFYGQIMMQKYLADPAISFCAVDDIECDSSYMPLQVTEFGQGIAIDQLLCKMNINGWGGGNGHESYDLAAYFYANHVDLMNCEIPFFFLTGDEAYWEKEKSEDIKRVFGHGTKTAEIDSRENWKKLMTMYNVFMVKKSYDDYAESQWNQTLGEERVFRISTAKACVDVMLGAIALTSGAKDMNGYIEDMKVRGQSEDRIKEVTNVLQKYADKLEKGEIIPIRNKVSGISSSANANPIQPTATLISVSEQEVSEISQKAEKLILEDLDDEGKKLRDDLIKIQTSKGSSVPREFICPLTKKIMIDPVMTSDGHSFERRAIECWFETQDVSPVTRTALDSKILLPNFAVKQLIKDFAESNK